MIAKEPQVLTAEQHESPLLTTMFKTGFPLVIFYLTIAAAFLIGGSDPLAVSWLTLPSTISSTTEPGFPVTFVDIAGQAGLSEPIVYGGLEQKKYIIETNGSGVAFLDYDNDGWTDILLLNGSRLEGFPRGKEPTTKLYRNNRKGSFADVTARAGVSSTGWGSGICAGDYNNDGFDDFYLTYWGRNVLYQNSGKGTFIEVTQKAGLTAERDRWGSGCTFVDYDRDGDLDLFVANYLKFDLTTAPEPGKAANCFWKGIPVNCGPKGLPTDTNLLYQNNGDGTFSDVSDKSRVAAVKNRYSMTAITTDFNNDGWPDIYVACDSTASTLYRNNRDGTFTDVALETGTAYNEDGQAQAGMGVTIGDYNRDGLLDIFKTHFADDLPVLYKHSGRDFYDDASRAAGFDHTRHVQWGTGFADFDNDSFPDLLIATGNVYPEVEKLFPEYAHRGPRLIYQNLGNGRFKDVTAQAGSGALTPKSSRGTAFGDFDNDGDVDVLVMNMNEPPSLLRNEYITRRAGLTNNWLRLKLIGSKSNRSAIGARVVVKDGQRLQVQEITSQSSYYSHNDLRLHFGMGSSSKVEQIEIRWPSGETETLKDIAVNQTVRIKEGSGVVR